MGSIAGTPGGPGGLGAQRGQRALRIALWSCLLGACAEDDASNAADGSVDAADAADAGDGVAKIAVTVTGPISGGMGMPFSTSATDLKAHGYDEQEYFFEGDALAYALDGDKRTDGMWTLEELDAQPYTSRMLVRRPTDAADFNGTVVVEWLNVSGGVDSDPGFLYNWQEIVREGYVWVGVTAQRTGIEGGGVALAGAAALPLKQYDPERYGPLAHPGDAHSFDIYTQAAKIVAGAGDMDVLRGLSPQRMIAYGESQSAMRLVSYVNGVYPREPVFDGFFIHSRSAGGVDFTNEATFAIGGTPAFIREDTDVPVFQFQTETDVLSPLFGYLAARQPDSERLRTWEVAGTAHADAYIMNSAGEASAGAIPCDGVNDGPQHFVLKGALHALNLWLIDGTAPANGEPLQLDAMGNAATDENGNTLGGVRTPHVDVPISLLSGLPPEGSSNVLCSLFGHTVPFTAEQLAALYATHDEYVAMVQQAADAARAGGFILEPEVQTMVDEASAAAVP